MASYVLSEDVQVNGRLGWGLEDTGDFSIRSAYEVMVSCDHNSQSVDWNLIWRLKVPMRITMFIWLVHHDRILTNVERARRGITSND